MQNAIKDLRVFAKLGTLVLIIAILYFGKEFLIPLALAALLSFVLSPLVSWLTKMRLPRAVSVALVTVLVFSALGAAGWFLGRELHHLVSKLPEHRENIQKRIESIKGFSKGGAFSRVSDMIKEIDSETKSNDSEPNNIPKTSTKAPNHETAEEDVDIQGTFNKGVDTLLNTGGTLVMNALGTASVTIVFVIFILLRQKELTQRIVSLAGFNKVTTTARVIDEATTRISSYLLMQGTVNGIYGGMLALSLWFIGLPYVALWGVLAALFRFIPYVGPIMVAALPIGLSLAVFDGWTQPIMVISVIIVLELITNMILEPLLYGQSAGVSDLALLVAITFWTWVWGGIGLILATPLTVCFVVLCRYIPSLQWVGMLMGERTEPEPHLVLYRQLLSEDEGAPIAFIDEWEREHGPDKTMDEVFIPAISLIGMERNAGKFNEEEMNRLYLRTRTLLDELKKDLNEEKAEVEEQNQDDALAESEVTDLSAQENSKPKIRVYVRSTHGDAGAQIAEYLEHAMNQSIEFKISKGPHLVGELIQDLLDWKPDFILLCVLEGTSPSTAALIRRIKMKLKDIKIITLQATHPSLPADQTPLVQAGSSQVFNTIQETQEFLERIHKLR